LIGLAVTAAVWLPTACLIRLESEGRVIFSQPRAGRGGCVFRLYKFRTMREVFDARGNPLADGDRLTRMGRLLRATSLDEVPSFWNVLRGDMSLVGPRPLPAHYLDRYTRAQARRHEVRPGITGWAQIHGRNTLSWEEKFVLDVWYVDHRSLRLDLKIMLLTVLKVVRHEGINQPGQATAEEFRGTPG